MDLVRGCRRIVCACGSCHELHRVEGAQTLKKEKKSTDFAVNLIFSVLYCNTMGRFSRINAVPEGGDAS